MRWLKAAILLLAAVAGTPARAAGKYDVVVYGGTPAGIAAAIAAQREGASVVLLEQTKHVGGLNTSGLGNNEGTHMFPKETWGGLCLDFYARMLGHYHPDADFDPRQWMAFEARVAERAFLAMLKDAEIPVRYDQRLDHVAKEGTRIVSLTTTDGDVFEGRTFIDATYEGDLMAAAGVSSRIGREARKEYDEPLAGIRYMDPPVKVAPYDAEGELLPGVSGKAPPAEGEGDRRVTCYNVRLNLTSDPANRVPIEKPANYDPRRYELLLRALEAGAIKSRGQILGFYALPNGKRELNNHQEAIVSLGMPGLQHGWAEASYAERERIHQAHRDYTQGLLWCLMNESRVPAAMRNDLRRFGLCKDEWADNGHWPYYLYVREARRMTGPVVLTEHDITTRRDKADAICLGSHYIDAHHVDRFAKDESSFVNEGRLWQKGKIFQIPYRAITPKETECANLLSPVCVSASHVAFCAIRVEPTWMKLGEAAGIAAVLSIRDGVPVQRLAVSKLQTALRKHGLPLDLPGMGD